ncbi:MAG: hypothetical protein MHM6MM_005811, partial [Cercozoa sp. M6MM]
GDKLDDKLRRRACDAIVNNADDDLWEVFASDDFDTQEHALCGDFCDLKDEL